MIDVIFLLLIFFVCTANLNAIEELLPTRFSFSGITQSEIPPELEFLDLKFARIGIVYQNRKPHWQVEGQNCNSTDALRNLLLRIAQAKNDLPIIIASDANVPWEHVIDAYDACRAAGLQKIQYEIARQ
jgi:biopolymer transport protein ExbD